MIKTISKLDRFQQIVTSNNYNPIDNKYINLYTI